MPDNDKIWNGGKTNEYNEMIRDSEQESRNQCMNCIMILIMTSAPR